MATYDYLYFNLRLRTVGVEAEILRGIKPAVLLVGPWRVMVRY